MYVEANKISITINRVEAIEILNCLDHGIDEFNPDLEHREAGRELKRVLNRCFNGNMVLPKGERE